MARPRNQDGRRRQLLDATALAVADRGLSGLRLKHIADRAGLSIGSVLYYYPDLDALLLEVHEAVLEQFYFDRLRATEAETDPVEQLLVAVRRGVPDEHDEATMRVIYELHVASSRDATHAALLTTLWEREVSLYEGILRRGVESGSFTVQADSHEVAETVVALEDAFDLHLTGRNAALDSETARSRILGYLSLVTGRDLSTGRHTR
jgi:AcrR family transcriptional regulator